MSRYAEQHPLETAPGRYPEPAPAPWELSPEDEAEYNAWLAALDAQPACGQQFQDLPF